MHSEKDVILAVALQSAIVIFLEIFISTYFFATEIWLACMQNGSFNLLFIVFSNFFLCLFSLIKSLHSSSEISKVLEIVLILYPFYQPNHSCFYASIYTLYELSVFEVGVKRFLTSIFLWWTIPEKFSKISWFQSLSNSASTIIFLYAWFLHQ